MADQIVKLEMGPPPSDVGPGAILKVGDDYYKVHHRIPDGVIASLCNDAEITVVRQGEARPNTNEARFGQVLRDEVAGVFADYQRTNTPLTQEELQTATVMDRQPTYTADIQTTYNNAQQIDPIWPREPHRVTGEVARQNPDEVPEDAEYNGDDDTFTWEDHRGTFTLEGGTPMAEAAQRINREELNRIYGHPVRAPVVTRDDDAYYDDTTMDPAAAIRVLQDEE